MNTEHRDLLQESINAAAFVVAFAAVLFVGCVIL